MKLSMKTPTRTPTRTPTKTRLLSSSVAIVFFGIVVFSAAESLAQPAEGTAPAASAPASGEPAAAPEATPEPVATNPASDAPLTAEQIAELDECRGLANKSERLRAQLKNDLRPDIQEADAAMTVRNKKHVIMAYAALWILTVGFLVLMFIRQRKLLAEIEGLRKEVADAAAD